MAVQLIKFLASLYAPYPIIGTGILVFAPDLLLPISGLFLAGSALIALIGFPALRRELHRVEQRGRGGYLYGYYDRGSIVPAVKIGRETTRLSRLQQHRTGAPLGIRVWFSVAVPDAVYAEGVLHRRYARSRVSRQNECFFYTPVMWFELMLLAVFG